MARAVWSAHWSRRAELGLDRGMLYVDDGSSVWDGLVTAKIGIDGGQLTPRYFEGQKYVSVERPSYAKGTLEVFSFPDLFEQCIGITSVTPSFQAHNQPRVRFDFAYRSRIIDQSGIIGHKIHLWYNAMATITESTHATINKTPEASTFVFELDLLPNQLPGFQPTAYYTVNTTKLDQVALAAFEDILYGSDNTNPVLPPPAELQGLLGDSLSPADELP